MRIIVVLIVFLSLFACQQEKKEFKVIDENFSYKLLGFDETEKSFKKGNTVRAAIQLLSGENTLYQQYEIIPFNPELSPFFALIKELNEGDSVYFKTNTDYFKNQHINLNWEGKEKVLEGYLKIYEFLTLDEIHQFKTKNDPELLEQKVLNRFVRTIPNVSSKNGVYLQTLQKGQGVSVELGKTLILKYQASFINGIEFDNTYYENYFEYTYGTPNQVIEGLDVALLGMKNKEKAKIIIPSQLAFGEDGSSTGIVPPFTSLVYDLEIIDIK
ncbi:MAG: FKBP-type peptidyl-prolyl cis-trans isomerase [Flavobacteriales bacterium]